MNYVALHAADFVTARDADVWAVLAPIVDRLARESWQSRTKRMAAVLYAAELDMAWQAAHPLAHVPDYALPEEVLA